MATISDERLAELMRINPSDSLFPPSRDIHAALTELQSLRSQAGVSEAVAWRPSYEQIIDVVEDCRSRRDKAGESSRMMAKWISEGINALYARPAPLR